MLPDPRSPDTRRLDETLANARSYLLARRTAGGHWRGRLSSSALSTATASFALAFFARANRTDRHRPLVENGLRWLVGHQNRDGGWGDTPLSFSNISTTALCWAALAEDKTGQWGENRANAEAWMVRAVGSLEPAAVARAVIARYGDDHTFSVPILTMLTLAGRLGPDGWKYIPQLPFELAACPHEWFTVVRLPVVSYALPALIAIGLVRHTRRPSPNPILRLVRSMLRRRTLQVLTAIQPTSGGFLEATPLTSFVAMSLLGAGEASHPVVRQGVQFLAASARPDGSWPIDTDLATWVTTLSVNALAGAPDVELPADDRRRVRDWLLAQQYRAEHPYTHAAPGGWAWTDLPGGVPDADDTPGALLALARLRAADDRTPSAAASGARWLLDLQNADGGIPTFCRGWGALPFDRSSADLTAHTLLAWAAWEPRLPKKLRRRIPAATNRGVAFLMSMQRTDGAWAPLWFGDQHGSEVENLTYGTSRVLRLAGKLRLREPLRARWDARLREARRWLLSAQQSDGGWGGRAGSPPSTEETALALEGLADSVVTDPDHPAVAEALARGVRWLAGNTDHGRRFDPSPIGFYFANLWYYEDLYPVIFTVAALGKVRAVGVAKVG